jgi:hypothetical protein
MTHHQALLSFFLTQSSQNPSSQSRELVTKKYHRLLASPVLYLRLLLPVVGGHKTGPLTRKHNNGTDEESSRVEYRPPAAAAVEQTHLTILLLLLQTARKKSTQ